MAQAFGKVILSGEHAVVYGTPALACGLGRGATATASRSAHSELLIDEKRVASDSEAGRALAALLANLNLGAHRVQVEVQIPTGVGLGASAAIGVAVAKAILETESEEAADDTARALSAADAWERVFHGNPSGIDAACALFGGCVRFQKGAGATPIAIGRPLPLAIAVAGPPSSTKLMVESVARLKARRPEQFSQTLEAITALVNNAQSCLLDGNLDGLGQLLDYNQMLLSAWFLSTEDIEKCCRVARESGARGAKLTGAGGGGCVIAVPGDEGSEPILEAWRAHGFRCFASVVGDPSADVLVGGIDQ
jgi:mevalonate kinase